MTQDMRSGKCALCGHDEVWQAPIKFSVVEPGHNTRASDNPGLLTTLVCAKCGHLQWFMENVASWRSTMLETGQARPSRIPTESRAALVPADTLPPLSASSLLIETDPAPPEPPPVATLPAPKAEVAPPPIEIEKSRPTPVDVERSRPSLEETALFDVLLLSAEDVESEVAHALESFGLASSKAYALAFATPAVVAEAIPQLQAERFRAALLASGAVAKIELVESNVSVSEVPAAEVPSGREVVNAMAPRAQVSQPPASGPVCRGCGKPVAHHQVMITQKGQLCAECYRELEAADVAGA